ncbi:alcohol dehydrogenase [Trichoderma arundinaceum]|uniref:Alcohol dehydrogenase n=1 Tax=Trichoderma arundinaceum TaxID=490622 RepID=A0A395NRB7_TRIAR|nr:alcohol dehydrogenase [Trichoderma arundinaceum]
MSRYEEAHANPQGPGDARPTALQIVKDEGVVGKLNDKVIVITGTSSGIGIETARALAATGAKLFLTARDLGKAKTALASFWDPNRMELVQLDLGSFKSVRDAAAVILAKSNQVNILINNAGIMAVPDLQFTEDGCELQFGTNHLSHFLFFQLLKPALLAASSPGFQSRVVTLASSGHRAHGINETGNYNFENGGYSPWISYAQSKTANIYMANEIERRYGSRGLHATSVHPGGVDTNLKQYIPPAQLQAARSNPLVLKIAKSPEQGAATTVWAAIGAEWEGKGGKYLSNCSVAPRGVDDGNMMSTDFVTHTYDAEKEARLWHDSIVMCGLDEKEEA